MPRALTAPELALLRGDGHWSKLYLAVLQPNTIYTAQLSSVPASTDRVHQISFGSGSGTLSDVKPNMTLYVGTSAGAFDLGMCRIRKAPIAGTFYIGLESDIRWNAGGTIYLTVVDDFDLWAKHATVADGVLSMDVDVSYSDQHSAFSPVPILGSHAVVWLDEATVDVEFDASDSWVFDSSISAYAWTAPGSSASSGMSTATPTITYNAVGCYRVFCTVTAANGKTTVGVRHVFVYDRDENMPATVFQLAQCVGDYDTGGWMFDMTMEAEASLSEIRDRSLVILFAEDWYGVPPEQTKQSIGPLLNRENIVCVGRVVGESLRWDMENGLVHFTVQGLHHWLNRIKAFPVELTWAGAAVNWGEMPALTVDRALWHILYWHSTAIETMDFTPSNDARYTGSAKTIASNIFGQLQDLAFSKIFASAGVNRWGQLCIEIDPQMVPEDDRDFAVVMDITDDDFADAIDFSRVTVHDCSLVATAAEEVNANGFSNTRYSLSPGHTPGRHGEPETPGLFLCSSQSQANQQAGLLYGWRTNPYPDVPVSFAENNRMLDLFPRQFCTTSIAAEDTPRGVSEDLTLIPRHMSIYYDGDIGYMRSEVNFESATAEGLAVDGDIPESEDVDFSTPGLPSLPSLPDLPILLPGLPGEGTASGPPKVLMHDVGTLGNNGVGMVYSNNFNSASPTWRTVNAGLTQAQYRSINRVIICPNGAVYVGRVMGHTDAYDYFLARAPYVGGTFVIIEDQASIDLKLTTSGPTQGRLGAFGFNPLVAEEVVYTLHKESSSNMQVWHGSGVTFAYNGVNFSAQQSKYSVSYGQGAWLITGRRSAAAFSFRLVNPGCTALISSTDYGTLFIALTTHVRLGTSGRTFHFHHSDDLVIGENNTGTTTRITGSAISNNTEHNFAMDPTGVYMMCKPGDPEKSSDGGYTWTNIGSLPVLQDWAFAYAGGAGATSRWIGGAAYVYYSEDFGVTWASKQGNLAALNPLFYVDAVKVVQF